MSVNNRSDFFVTCMKKDFLIMTSKISKVATKE